MKKKKIKTAAGWIGKKFHPAGLPETSLYFFWPYYHFCISRHVALNYHPTKFGDNYKTQC